MSSMIVVNYDPFSVNSQYSVYRDDQLVEISAVSSNIEQIAAILANRSTNYSINNIKVHAPSYIFEELERVINTNYANNNLIMENY